MLKKYPNRLKLYNEIPHIKEVISKYTTEDMLNKRYKEILDEYQCTDYFHAHQAFVYEVARFVFRAEHYRWYDYAREKYQACDKHFLALFSAVLEIEYGIPSYRV